MDLLEELTRRGGVARVKALTDAGVARHHIRSALAGEAISRPSHGVVALPDASPQTVVAVQLGAARTCVTALAHYGVPLPSPRLDARLHFAVPRSFSSHGRDLRDVRLHYAGGAVGGGNTCPISEALDASGACLDEVWQLVAVDSALNKGLITLRDVAAFTRSSRRRKDFLLANADGRAQSAGETIARLALVVAGHRVCPQAYVPGAGHVDIEVDGMVVVEIDGYEHHHDAKAFRSDRERDRVTVKAGRPVLRYAASEMTSAWRPDIVADVRAALAAWDAGGHRRGR